MYSFFYRKYMAWMPWLGGYRVPVARATPSVSAHPSQDTSATDYGNAYRGVGVLTGLLGIAIVFAAVAPGAFELENILALRCFGILKVSMMCLMLFLVYTVGQRSGLKDRWISARRESEKDRYQTLRELIQLLEGGKNEQHAAPVVAELSRILLGENGQIHYNRNKAHQYEAIEKAAVGISWTGFFCALVCAFLILLAEFHWIHHQSALILGTAFLPALVGGVHGINGFLTVGNLAADHKAMADYLHKSSDALHSLAVKDVDQVLEIARSTYMRLEGRDAEWIEKTQTGNRLIVG